MGLRTGQHQRYGGFIWGDLRYGDIGMFDLHVGSVPIAVPVLMAAILWPTYAAVYFETA